MDYSEVEENVKKALGAHGQWKMKLRHAVEIGRLPKPAKDIACDDQCGLGLWLVGMRTDPSSNTQEYQAVVKAHAHFHKEAGKVAALVEAGDKARASTELDGPAYAMATDMLKKTLINMRRQARA